MCALKMHAIRRVGNPLADLSKGSRVDMLLSHRGLPLTMNKRGGKEVEYRQSGWLSLQGLTLAAGGWLIN